MIKAKDSFPDLSQFIANLQDLPELPEEIWILILGNLDVKSLISISMTNRKFHQLAFDPSLWKQTQWTVAPVDLLNHQESYAGLFSRLEKLELLKIEGHSSGSKSEKSRLEFLSAVPNLKKLEVNMVGRSNGLEVHPDLPLIVSLFNLTSIDFGHSQINDKVIEAIRSPNLRKFISLREITRSFHWNWITDSGVSSLVTKCPNLQVIRIYRCCSISDQAFQKIGESCHKLEILDLGHFFSNVSDLGMESVATNCKALRELAIFGPNITDKTLELLGRNCPDIEALKLDYCSRVTETGVRHFVEQGSKPLKLEVLVWDDNQKDWIEPEYLSGLRREYGRLNDTEEQEE